MPEAAVHKNGHFLPDDGEVGPDSRNAPLDPIAANADRPTGFPQRYLGLCDSPNLGHDPASLFC
jgi:hypothetical protein